MLKGLDGICLARVSWGSREQSKGAKGLQFDGWRGVFMSFGEKLCFCCSHIWRGRKRTATWTPRVAVFSKRLHQAPFPVSLPQHNAALSTSFVRSKWDTTPFLASWLQSCWHKLELGRVHTSRDNVLTSAGVSTTPCQHFLEKRLLLHSLFLHRLLLSMLECVCRTPFCRNAELIRALPLAWLAAM